MPIYTFAHTAAHKLQALSVSCVGLAPCALIVSAHGNPLTACLLLKALLGARATLAARSRSLSRRITNELHFVRTSSHVGCHPRVRRCDLCACARSASPYSWTQGSEGWGG